MGTQRNTVGSLFICALLYNFGLTLPWWCYNLHVLQRQRMQCTQSVGNTRVTSCVFITLLCNNYFPQKFITHKDLDSLLHSFPSCPAVWSAVRPAMVCGGVL